MEIKEYKKMKIPIAKYTGCHGIRNLDAHFPGIESTGNLLGTIKIFLYVEITFNLYKFLKVRDVPDLGRVVASAFGFWAINRSRLIYQVPFVWWGLVMKNAELGGDG